MADFLKGFALGGEKGWEIGSAMATKKGDRERRKEDQREALRLELLRKGYVDSPTKIESMSLEDLSMAIALQEEQNRKKAERRKREYDQEVLADAREFGRHALEGERNWQLFQQDADRAYDDIKKQDEARRKVAGFDPKIREQVSQAPSLIRSDAPSLPVPEEFQGSKLEDITRSLKEEKGETDWLARAARGAQLQSVENDIRKRGADFAHAMKVKGYEAAAKRFASAGANPKIVFDEIVEKDSVVPVEHQRAYFDAARNAYASKVSLSDRAMFETTAPSVMKEANKYKRYMTAMPSPKTFSSLNQLGEWQSKIDDAKLRSEIADLQRKVKGTSLKRLEDSALNSLPERTLLSIKEAWDVEHKEQQSELESDRSAVKVGKETAARVAATPKVLKKRLKWIHGLNNSGDLEVTVVPNPDSEGLPTEQDYVDAYNHAKRMGWKWKEGTPPPQIFRNDAEIKAAISAGQLAVGDSYTYIDPRTGEKKTSILEEE